MFNGAQNEGGGTMEKIVCVTSLGSWGSPGSGHAGIEAWVGGNRRRKCPRSSATQLVAWRHRAGVE